MFRPLFFFSCVRFFFFGMIHTLFIITTQQKLILKRKNVQKYGIEVLCELKLIFDKLGIINFADFGTLLGLIRDDKLLSHDLDLDYGIITETYNIENELVFKYEISENDLR